VMRRAGQGARPAISRALYGGAFLRFSKPVRSPHVHACESGSSAIPGAGQRSARIRQRSLVLRAPIAAQTAARPQPSSDGADMYADNVQATHNGARSAPNPPFC
jgi:hypothetical protein